MTTSIEDVQKILAQLDSGDPTHWTDDGAPSLEAVQLLGNDTSITRDQLNKAIPGFSRSGSAGEEEHDEGIEPVKAEIKAIGQKAAAKQKVMVEPRASTAAPVVSKEDPTHEDSYILDPKDPLSDAPTLSQDRLKEIMQGRMARAQARLDEARATVTEAQAYAVKCETFLNQATAAFHKQFPPMHEMDAIKEHLRRSMQHRAEAVGRPDLYRDGTLAPSPLDSRLSGRDNRGHRVPQLAR